MAKGWLIIAFVVVVCCGRLYAEELEYKVAIEARYLYEHDSMYLASPCNRDMPNELQGIYYQDHVLYYYNEICECMQERARGNSPVRSYMQAGPGPGEHEHVVEPIVAGRGVEVAEYSIPPRVKRYVEGRYVETINLDTTNEVHKIKVMGGSYCGIELPIEYSASGVTIGVMLSIYNQYGLRTAKRKIGQSIMDMVSGDRYIKALQLVPLFSVGCYGVVVQDGRYESRVVCYNEKAKIMWQVEVEIPTHEYDKGNGCYAGRNLLPPERDTPIVGLWQNPEYGILVERNRESADDVRVYNRIDGEGRMLGIVTIPGIPRTGDVVYQEQYAIWSNVYDSETADVEVCVFTIEGESEPGVEGR